MNAKYKIIFFSAFIVFFCVGKVLGAYVFQRELHLGDRGDDVLYLQQILNKDEDTLVANIGAGSVGFETNYFGQKTRDAVMRFQEKYRAEILSPLKLNDSTGVVGQRTMAKLNSIYGDNILPVDSGSNISLNISSDVQNTSEPDTKLPEPALPRVTSVNPIIIFDPQNTEIIITGSNFDKKSRVFLLTRSIELFDKVLVNSDGTELRVKLSTILQNNLENILNNSDDEKRKLIVNALKSQYETYDDYGIFMNAKLFVQNSVGDSNVFPLKINIYRNDTTLPKK